MTSQKPSLLTWSKTQILATKHTNTQTNHTLTFFRTSKSLNQSQNISAESNPLSALFNPDYAPKQITFCIHGAGGCAEQFRYLFDIFAEDEDNLVCSFDWFGHRTSFNGEQNDWDEYGATMLENDLDFFVRTCLEEFERETHGASIPPLTMVAHSYGTGLMVRLLTQKVKEAQIGRRGWEQNVDKVALLSTTDARPKVAQSFLWRLPVFFVEWIRPLLSAGNKRLMYHENTSQEEVEYWANVASTNSIAMMRALCRQMEWFTVEDVAFVHEEMKHCKFLIISGERDSVTDPNDARNVAEACDAEMLVCINTSHNLMVEDANAIVRFILGERSSE